mmetsp:Transcript_73290/g.162745  ORF Transcript_73290/g.162745 Transcript_73290/m.162745 type:complete len:333 (-) Transcript_73290:322-1320(-)
MTHIDLGTPHDDAVPSVFEVLAQQRLMPALQQALHYVLAVGAQRYPRWLLPLHRRREEVHLMLAALLEAHSLRTTASSFGEHFYGLRRTTFSAQGQLQESSTAGAPSRARASAAAFALLIIPPYLRAKLDPVLDVDDPSDVAASSMMRAARLAHRVVCALVDGQQLIQLLLFLFDRSPFATPAQRVLGFSLRRAIAADAASERSGRPQGPSAKLLALLETPLRQARQLLLLSVLGFRLVEWWHAPQHAPAPRLTLIPPPPPPPSLHPGVVTSAVLGVCGICQREPVEPTVAPSGYVFCAQCIHEAVVRQGCCPLTKLPAQLDELRKLFETNL